MVTKKQPDYNPRATVKGFMTNLYFHCVAGGRKEDVAQQSIYWKNNVVIHQSIILK